MTSNEQLWLSDLIVKQASLLGIESPVEQRMNKLVGTTKTMARVGAGVGGGAGALAAGAGGALAGEEKAGLPGAVLGGLAGGVAGGLGGGVGGGLLGASSGINLGILRALLSRTKSPVQQLKEKVGLKSASADETLESSEEQPSHLKRNLAIGGGSAAALATLIALMKAKGITAGGGIGGAMGISGKHKGALGSVGAGGYFGARNNLYAGVGGGRIDNRHMSRNLALAGLGGTVGVLGLTALAKKYGPQLAEAAV
jgi:hypothetical protein